MSDQHPTRFFPRLALQIVPLLWPVLVGVGSAAITALVYFVRIEDRVAILERDVSRHEESIEKDMRRLENLTLKHDQHDNEQDKRLTQFETALGGMREDVREMKADIKQILREKRAQQ